MLSVNPWQGPTSQQVILEADSLKNLPRPLISTYLSVIGLNVVTFIVTLLKK